jgi:hypothetical protein
MNGQEEKKMKLIASEDIDPEGFVIPHLRLKVNVFAQKNC